MARFTWKLDATVLGLSLLCVSVGVNRLGSAPDAQPDRSEQVRALTETLLIGAVAGYVTRSYVPIVAPVGVLAFDYAWSAGRGKMPQIGMVDDGS